MENQIRLFSDIAAEIYDDENVATNTSSDQVKCNVTV